MIRLTSHDSWTEGRRGKCLHHPPDKQEVRAAGQVDISAIVSLCLRDGGGSSHHLTLLLTAAVIKSVEGVNRSDV